MKNKDFKDERKIYKKIENIKCILQLCFYH